MPRGARLVLILAGAALAVLLVRSSVAGVYRVAGPSDAPSLVWHRLVLVHLAAYELRLPGLDRPVLRWAEPRCGDMALFLVPEREVIGFKRVVAVAGDTVATVGHRLIVNGVPATYRLLDRAAFRDVPRENRLGEHVAIERIGSAEHLVTWSPGGGSAPDAGPLVVPPGHLFVLGDNRDASFDSRLFGPLPRARIRGRLIGPERRPPRS